MAALSLDHLRAVGTARSSAKCASRRPGRSGAGRRGPRDRRVTAEHVTTCETPSHHARRPAGRNGAGAREPPLTADPPILSRPTPPTRPGATRADHLRPAPRPTALNDPPHHTRETHSDTPEHPPGEEDPSEQTATTTFTPHVFKTTPE